MVASNAELNPRCSDAGGRQTNNVPTLELKPTSLRTCIYVSRHVVSPWPLHKHVDTRGPYSYGPRTLHRMFHEYLRMFIYTARNHVDLSASRGAILAATHRSDRGHNCCADSLPQTRCHRLPADWFAGRWHRPLASTPRADCCRGRSSLLTRFCCLYTCLLRMPPHMPAHMSVRMSSHISTHISARIPARTAAR